MILNFKLVSSKRFFKQKFQKSMTDIQRFLQMTFTGNSFYGKLGLTSPQSRAEPRVADYCFFHDFIVNPHTYRGLESLPLIENPCDSQEEFHYTNPKTSFYLCKKYLSSVEFQKMPRYLMKRLAYRKVNEVDEWGRVIYNDTDSKNYDQVATEYHCLKLLKGSYRAIQLISVIHENTKFKEDKRFFYHNLKLPDRRSKGIKNICFVVEEMKGGSLREQTQKNILAKSPFTEEKVIEYACQIAQGLLELRSKGIIHRDLRPDNILVQNGQIKFADFDSAFIKGYSDYRNIKNGVDMKETTPLQIMLLIAESEANLKQISSVDLYQKQEKADIYFLGVNIYTMVFTQMFQSFNGGKILKNLINIKKRSGFSPKLLDLMEKCLEKDPHLRIDLNEVVRVLSELERQFYLRSSSYKRTYLSAEPLNLSSFSSNDMGRRLQVEQSIFQNEDLHNRDDMEKSLSTALKTATLDRNTNLFEGLFKTIIQQVENMDLWADNSKGKLYKLNKNHLMEQIESYLQRLHIKAYYYELAYRILCGVNLTVIKSPIYFQNIRTHIELFSSELVVVLTFLYQTILKCSFTSDPHYQESNPCYQVRRVIQDVKKLYSRWQFFAGRLQLQKKANKEKKKMRDEIQNLKNIVQGEDLNELKQFEQNYKVKFQGVKVFESILQRINILKTTQYNTIEERFYFSFQERNTMKCLQRIESMVKNEMIQTIINLIIAYEDIKTQQWGHRSNLKNTIFMMMILETQNTRTLEKNDMVAIKEELTAIINLKLGWKSEELEAFFNNYTQTHKDEVIKGLGELESQAVLAPPPESSKDICIQVLGSDQELRYTQAVSPKKMPNQSSLQEIEDSLNSQIKPEENQKAWDRQDKDQIVEDIPDVSQIQLKETFDVKIFATEMKQIEDPPKKKTFFLQIEQNIVLQNLESVELK